MKKIFFLTIFALFIPLTIYAADSTQSNTVITQFGNAPQDQKPKTSSPRSIVAPPEGDLREVLINTFGITMNGFNQKQLQWAWEKLTSVQQTNFTSLTRGTVMTATSGSISSQTGCRTVNLGTYNDETVFKVTLNHELGHIIYWCNENPQNKKSEHQDAFNKEGGITGYAANPCYGTSGLTEDYAEMVAYYLNPNITELTPCHNRGVVPFANGKYPMHYNIAKGVLENF